MVEKIGSELLIENLSWKKVGEYLDEGFTTIIVPSGAIEQHGPHLALKTDRDLAEEVSRRLAKRSHKTLVSSSLSPGLSGHHMGFPGTLTLQDSTFIALLSDVTRSLIRHGFKTIIHFPWHGGNFALTEKVCHSLNEEYSSQGIRVKSLWTIGELDYCFHQCWERFAPDTVLGAQHAGIEESSMMFAIDESSVNASEIIDTEARPPSFEKMFANGLRHYTPTGTFGSAAGFSKEIGEQCFEFICDFLLKKFE